MTSKQQNSWETRYQSQKTGWDRGDINPQLKIWLEKKALSPCRILVPGCGNGYEVIELAAAGFDVVAVDIADTPVRNLREQLKRRDLKAEVVQGDLLVWGSESKFDAVYEQTSLCALDPASWQQYEQQLRRWLRPKGKMFTLFMQTQKQGGPPFHCALPEMRALFTKERWVWSDENQKISHSAGLHELIYILEKA